MGINSSERFTWWDSHNYYSIKVGLSQDQITFLVTRLIVVKKRAGGKCCIRNIRAEWWEPEGSLLIFGPRHDSKRGGGSSEPRKYNYSWWCSWKGKTVLWKVIEIWLMCLLFGLNFDRNVMLVWNFQIISNRQLQ